MKEMHNIKRWEIWGAIFTMMLGTLLHFTYDWLGKTPIAGVFGAVNESTWEHLKLLFWPFILFSVVEYFIEGKFFNRFMEAKAAGVMAGMAAIVIIFYTYVGIIGTHFLWVDILTFFMGVALSFWASYHLMTKKGERGKKEKKWGGVALVVLVVLFVSFTFSPPKLALFEDPSTKEYGIDQGY